MKIGIPRAFLYYKYKDLWINFFKEVGVEVVLSPLTNKEVLKNGIHYAIDESCLSAKIYLGHVHYLIDKCDYVLVSRIAHLKNNDELCSNFFGLYDIVQNSYPDLKILPFMIDYEINQTELKAFLDMATMLNISKVKAAFAYKKAKDIEKLAKNKAIAKQNELLKTNNTKILIVGHSYNSHDEIIGKSIEKALKELNVTPIYADIVDSEKAKAKAKEISKTLYWAYNKELLGAIEFYKKDIDGIILLTTFPCGPDSLVNEMIIRKIKDKPIIVIMIDEQDASAGVLTRLESFVDIIEIKKSRGL